MIHNYSRLYTKILIEKPFIETISIERKKKDFHLPFPPPFLELALRNKINFKIVTESNKIIDLIESLSSLKPLTLKESRGSVLCELQSCCHKDEMMILC